MYTKSVNVSRKPSLSALKRQRAILNRALRKQQRINFLIESNQKLANEITDLKYGK